MNTGFVYSSCECFYPRFVHLYCTFYPDVCSTSIMSMQVTSSIITLFIPPYLLK